MIALRKLQSERQKGKFLKIKTYLNFDEKHLIVQVQAPGRLIERHFPNSKLGKKGLSKFLSQFNSKKSIEQYFNLSNSSMKGK